MVFLSGRSSRVGYAAAMAGYYLGIEQELKKGEEERR
jgi:hypothetical protein